MQKSTLLLIAGAFVFNSSFSQSTENSDKKAPNGWHQLDKTESGFNGISLNKAYDFLKTKKLKSKKVLVAVIDSGIDTLHEDLKPVLWTNPKEIPGNGIDDDKNGYVDDVHGWNFIGGKDGKNVKEDSDEGARVYHKLKQKWDGITTITESNLSPADLKSYQTYLRAKEKVVGEINEAEIGYLKTLYPKFLVGDSVLRKEIGKEEYNGNDLKDNNTTNADAKMTKNLILSISKSNDSYDITNQQLIDEIGGQLRKADAAVKAPPTYRKDIVKDNEQDFNDKFYGNNDIMASTPFHGTHCSGIIGAVRNNTGVDGIADNVSIMMLRAVPDGDEHDKDIALAIRYAVDNGARIISMSFGKDFSPEKYWVDDAFKYAEKKGVLLVHAAGNDAKNIDTAYNFPNPVFENTPGRASNVITVGASGDEKTGGLTASFSNFGKNEVDVFAPGVNIYSTIPGGNTYGNASGTSMACPVVAGISALLLEYYPTLTAIQLKSIIEKSAVVCTEEVKKPGTDEKVKLSELSRTGAFANAFEAVKMADTITKSNVKTKAIPEKKTK